MSWEMHEAAKKIADGWYEELEESRKRNAVLARENAKLRELVRDLWLAGSLCDAISDVRLQAKGGDWRTMQERVDEALGIEVDG